MTEVEMVGWHHRLNGHEFEQTLVIVKDREAWHAATLQSHKELDTTEQLNKNNNKNFSFQHRYPAI